MMTMLTDSHTTPLLEHNCRDLCPITGSTFVLCLMPCVSEEDYMCSLTVDEVEEAQIRCQIRYSSQKTWHCHRFSGR